MRNLIYIFFLLPLFVSAQVPDLLMASYQQANACSADANEQATTANASSDPNCNEANATTGWAGLGATIAVESSDVNTGSYAIKITTTAATGNAQYTLSATSGDTFDVSFYVKAVTDAGGTSARDATNCTGAYYATPLPSSWTLVSYSITASSTGNILIRVFPGISDTIGNVTLVDDFSIIKTN